MSAQASMLMTTSRTDGTAMPRGVKILWHVSLKMSSFNEGQG